MDTSSALPHINATVAVASSVQPRKRKFEPSSSPDASGNRDSNFASDGPVDSNLTAVYINSMLDMDKHIHASIEHQQISISSAAANVTQIMRPIASSPSSHLSVCSMAASPNDLCAMLRLVRRDIDAASSILAFSDWRDWAFLHSSCRTWRDYIANNRYSVTINHDLIVDSSQYKQIFKSTWVRLRAVSLSLFHKFRTDLSHLYLLNRLRYCYFSLSMHSFSQSTFEVIGCLSKLEELYVHWKVEEDVVFNSARQKARSLRFTPLQQLLLLKQLNFEPCHEYYCTKDQMMDLVQIKSLTRLECGVLIGDPHAWMVDDRSRAQWIADTAALLPQMLNLKWLWLQNQRMTLDCWIHVTNVLSLESLSVCCENSDITDEWRWIANFRNTLRCLCFVNDHYVPGAPVESSPLLDGLIPCTLLERLRLSTVKLSKTQLMLIVTQLKCIRQLQFDFCGLESLEPLSLAASLEKLKFEEVLNNDSYSFQWAIDLPSLPRLASLSIVEDWFKSPETCFKKTVDSERLMDTIFDCMKMVLAGKMPQLTENHIEFGWADDLYFEDPDTP